MLLAELHHAYDDPDVETTFRPLKTGDTVRVFHGFHRFDHALEIAKYGMSGKERVARLYSYENDNNPHGLFITMKFKIAADFVGAYVEQCIMEFTSNFDDMEAPVWPGGSYTVQGEQEQFFGHGATGRAKRRQRGREAEQEVVDTLARRDDPRLAHIGQSDKKNLAFLLTNTREYQALFVGDLHPDAITAFYIRPSGARITDPWSRLSRQDFIAKYGAIKIKTDKHMRLFAPTESFDGEQFLERLSARMNRGSMKVDANEIVGNIWSTEIAKSANPKQGFLRFFTNYLWPRQYADALRWMKRTY
jgi:hypothetical protein